jgi:hypothetical protein
VAVSAFPDEIYTAPRSWAEKAYPKLIYYNKAEIRTMGVCIVGVDPDRLRVVSDGVVKVTLGGVGGAPAYKTARCRIDTDRRGTSGDGAVKVALGTVGAGAVVVGAGISTARFCLVSRPD